MLYSSQSLKVPLTYDHHPANWEDDIQDVVVESCNTEEDPTGYRVIFYRDTAAGKQDAENSYSMGASYLRNRLKKLSRAGFEAPMTERALHMINQKRL